MYRLPFVLDPDVLEDAGPKRLRREALGRFGQTPITEWPGEIALGKARGAFQQEAEDEWRKGFALELLFGRLVDAESQPECPVTLHDVTPFEDCGITLWELWKAEVVVVLIPVRSASGEGGLVQMWLVRIEEIYRDRFRTSEPDHRNRLDGLASWLANGVKGDLLVFLRSTEPELERGGIVGASWMLGAELALRALKRGDRETLRLLGSEWIVTGEVGPSGNVAAVGMLGKINLDLSRRWLIPAANEPDLPPRFRTRYAGRIGLVIDTESAWRHLTGAGTQREHPTELWPRGDEVEALHGLVSPAVRPLIASILYTRPKKLFLWHSTETGKQALMIQGVVEILKNKRVLPPEFLVTPLLLNSGDLVKAEEDLRSQSEIISVNSRPILFNITGGNMLMKYAVINLAALNPGLWLLYRDASNAASHDFVRLRTLGTQFAISPLRGEETENIQWDFLFGFSREDTVESLVSGIFGEETSTNGIQSGRSPET